MDGDIYIYIYTRVMSDMEDQKRWLIVLEEELRVPQIVAETLGKRRWRDDSMLFACPRLGIDDMTKEGDSYGDIYGSEI